MKLLYQGKNGEFINDVPAMDLDESTIKELAEKWDKSVAETEGLLIKGGLYKAEKQAKTSKEKEGD